MVAEELPDGRRQVQFGHASGTEHGNSRSWFYLRSFEDSPHSGGNAAANERRSIERHVFAYRDYCVLMNQHFFSKTAKSSKLGDRSAVTFG